MLSVRPFVAPLALAALGLAACQDPSGVGLDVIGEEGGAPGVVVVAADTARLLTEEPDGTGGFGTGITPAQARLLVGRAQDPLLGDVEAVAYLDVSPPSSVPGGFDDDPLLTATLRLVRDYVYGDSTATLPLDLHAVGPRGFNPVGAPSDTAFAVGDLLQSYTVNAADTLVSLQLPDAWVQANAGRLRSDSVLAAVDGFRLRVPDGAQPNAVLGFQTFRTQGGSAFASSVLRLTTAEDTVDYPLREVFSAVTRGPAAAPPPDRLIARDEAGEALALHFDLAALDTLALANGTLRLNVDPAAIAGGPFKRSLPPRVGLFGVLPDEGDEEGDRVLLAEGALDRATNQYAFTSAGLTRGLQRALLGDPLYERFELTFPTSPASLDALPLVLGPPPAAGGTDPRPRFALTVITDPG